MAELPVLVEALRGPIVESCHRGSVAVMRPDGRLHARAGDPSLVSFMRSTAKPVQALPLLARGWAEHFGFTPAELAVMAASHSGEPLHTELVGSILAKVGLDKSKLRCGAHPPFDPAAQAALDGRPPDVLQNNCSGKHAGMLAQCVAAGVAVETYEAPDHPVQQEIRRTLALMAGVDPESVPTGVDGCSAPVFGLSIGQMALAYARLVSPAALDPALHEACHRIVAAMLDYPEVVAGTRERVCTDIMRACGRAVIAKIGAEGVYTMGVLPNDRYPAGLGIAFKVEDGAGRATAPVAVAVLDQLGLLDDAQRAQLAGWRHKSITNHRGLVVGHLRPAFQLEFL